MSMALLETEQHLGDLKMASVAEDWRRLGLSAFGSGGGYVLQYRLGCLVILRDMTGRDHVHPSDDIS